MTKPILHRQRLNFSNTKCAKTWPRGYKTVFMLNSAEHEICPANKYQIANNC